MEDRKTILLKTVYDLLKKCNESYYVKDILCETVFYDDLSSEAKNEVNIHRTILAFESEVLKPKNMLKLGDYVTNSNKLVGFADTLRLFNPM
jgi:hypothetical protein